MTERLNNSFFPHKFGAGARLHCKEFLKGIDLFALWTSQKLVDFFRRVNELINSQPAEMDAIEIGGPPSL
jgi:hypothetical protein